jgi:hypothetical protein
MTCIEVCTDDSDIRIAQHTQRLSVQVREDGDAFTAGQFHANRQPDLPLTLA